MLTGTVTEYKSKKRFGYITVHGGGKLVVRPRDLVETSSPLSKGRDVQFDISPDGQHVTNVLVKVEVELEEPSTEVPAVDESPQETEDVAEVPTLEETPVVTGTVMRFDQYGRGVIVQDGDGPNVCVEHWDIPVNSLEEGQRVEFTVVNGDKGPQAKNVHVIDAPDTDEVSAAESPRTPVDRVARFGKKRQALSSWAALQKLQEPAMVRTRTKLVYSSTS